MTLLMLQDGDERNGKRNKREGVGESGVLLLQGEQG